MATIQELERARTLTRTLKTTSWHGKYFSSAQLGNSPCVRLKRFLQGRQSSSERLKEIFSLFPICSVHFLGEVRTGGGGGGGE